jgi:hypothetical protein
LDTDRIAAAVSSRLRDPSPGVSAAAEKAATRIKIAFQTSMSSTTSPAPSLPPPPSALSSPQAVALHIAGTSVASFGPASTSPMATVKSPKRMEEFSNATLADMYPDVNVGPKQQISSPLRSVQVGDVRPAVIMEEKADAGSHPFWVSPAAVDMSGANELDLSDVAPIDIATPVMKRTMAVRKEHANTDGMVAKFASRLRDYETEPQLPDSLSTFVAHTDDAQPEPHGGVRRVGMTLETRAPDVADQFGASPIRGKLDLIKKRASRQAARPRRAISAGIYLDGNGGQQDAEAPASFETPSLNLGAWADIPEQQIRSDIPKQARSGAYSAAPRTHGVFAPNPADCYDDPHQDALDMASQSSWQRVSTNFAEPSSASTLSAPSVERNGGKHSAASWQPQRAGRRGTSTLSSAGAASYGGESLGSWMSNAYDSAAIAAEFGADPYASYPPSPGKDSASPFSHHNNNNPATHGSAPIMRTSTINRAEVRKMPSSASTAPAESGSWRSNPPSGPRRGILRDSASNAALLPNITGAEHTTGAFAAEYPDERSIPSAPRSHRGSALVSGAKTALVTSQYTSGSSLPSIDGFPPMRQSDGSSEYEHGEGYPAPPKSRAGPPSTASAKSRAGPSVAASDNMYTPSDQLGPLLGAPEAAIHCCITNFATDNWERQFEGLNILRQLAISCPHILGSSPQLHALATNVSNLADSLRSSLAKNGAMAVVDMFMNLGRALDAEIEPIMCILLKRSADTAIFISSAADAALAAITMFGTESRVLGSILAACNHKNPSIKMSAGVWLPRVVIRMAKRLSANPRDLDRVVALAGKNASEGNPNVRYASQRILLTLLSSGIIDERFVSRVMTERLSSRLFAALEKAAPPEDTFNLDVAVQTVLHGQPTSPSGAVERVFGGDGDDEGRPRAGSSGLPLASPSGYGMVSAGIASRSVSGARRVGSASATQQQQGRQPSGGAISYSIDVPDEPEPTSTAAARPIRTAVPRAKSVTRGGARPAALDADALSPDVADAFKLLKTRLAASDWKERVSALGELSGLAQRERQLLQNVSVVDEIAARIADAHQKVAAAAIQAADAIIPVLPAEALDRAIPILLPALVTALSSSNRAHVENARSTLDRMVFSGAPAPLVQPLATIIKHGNTKLKGFLLDRLAACVPDAFAQRPTVLTRTVLPLVFELLDDPKSEIKTHVAAIVSHAIACIGPDAILDCANLLLSAQGGPRVGGLSEAGLERLRRQLGRR